MWKRKLPKQLVLCNMSKVKYCGFEKLIKLVIYTNKAAKVSATGLLSHGSSQQTKSHENCPCWDHLPDTTKYSLRLVKFAFVSTSSSTLKLHIVSMVTQMQTYIDVVCSLLNNCVCVTINTVLKLLLFITVRNSNCGKVMFSQAFVKNSVHRGEGVHPPGRHPPPLGRHPLPRLPLQRMVRILLECILV